MSEWKESTGNFWKPEKVDDSIHGLYINKESHVGQNDSNLYYIEKLDDHEVLQVWGSTVLDQRMMPVKTGQEIKITYKGLGEKGKGGKQAPKLWKVEYRDIDESLVF
jgi:hypothetical protein